MDELTARKKELYRAYDEAALRILMDRLAEEQGQALLEELRAIPAEEASVPAGEARAVTETLALCGRRKRSSMRRSAALRTCGKVAAVLLVLGSLAGFASFTASAHQEKQAARAESGWSLPSEREEREGEPVPDETDREDLENEVRKTAD